MHSNSALFFLNNSLNWSTKNKKAIYTKYLTFISFLNFFFLNFQNKLFEIFLKLPATTTNFFKFFFYKKKFDLNDNPISYLMFYIYI